MKKMTEDIIQKYLENYKKEIEQALKHRSYNLFDTSFTNWEQNDLENQKKHV